MSWLKKALFYIFVNVGLIIIGLIIVYMFLEHSLLYQLGLPALIVVGALLVFVTLRLIMFFTTYEPGKDKAKTVILFSKEEKDQVLTGNKIQKILHSIEGQFKGGELVDAKTCITETEPFCQLRIKRASVKKLDELSRTDALKEGKSSLKELRKALKGENRADSKFSVVVFRLEE